MSASEAALLAKNAETDLTGIQDKEERSAYEVWQQRVLAHFLNPAHI